MTDTERCGSTHPDLGYRCVLPANHSTHLCRNTAWATLERLDGHVLVRAKDLAEVLAVASGLVTPGTSSEVIDRLNAELSAAIKEADQPPTPAPKDSQRATAPDQADLRSRIADAIDSVCLNHPENGDCMPCRLRTNAVMAVVQPVLDAKDAEIERLRARLTSSQSGLVHVIAAVERSGDRAATTAMFTALGQASGSEALTELNRLRRELADTRDELATMTADRDAKHHDAAEAAVELATAQLRADEAERALAEKMTEVKYATDVGHAIAAEWEKCTEAADRRAARFRLAWESARRGRHSWRQRAEAAEAQLRDQQNGDHT